MDVPTTASAVVVLQMIEAKLTEEGRDPRNVQVLLSGTQPGQEITLEDETGTILEIPQDEETTAEVEGGAGTGTGSDTGSEPGHVEEGVLETLRSDLAEAQEQTEALQEEVKQLQDQLGKEKNKYKSLWKVYCQSTIEFDVYVSEKDNEIEILTRRIAERAADTGYPAPRDRTGSRASSPDSTASGRSPGPVPVTTTGSRGSGVRMGKAPPVDSFHGDSRSIKLDEWLPTLERAATWNAWSEQDKLLQLAGHLRGRALQEWSLLQGSEKQTMDSAVEALRNRLDPGSRMLGALEFKHMSQHPKEGVCEFITRLEKAFREAYGREPLSKETIDALLFAQLQDGLRYGLVQAPAVSGALCYEKLCIAAKGEERRLVALRKRQELGGGRSHDGLVPPRIRPKSMTTSQTEGRHPRDERDRSGKRVC